MSTKFLLLCVILAVLQHTAFGLNCYGCVAGTDGCGTSFNSKGSGVIQVVQTASSAGCGKYVSTSNTNSITRSSLSSCTATTVAATTGNDGYTLYCCTTDLCNGTQMKSASVMLAMLVAALAFFFKM